MPGFISDANVLQHYIQGIVDRASHHATNEGMKCLLMKWRGLESRCRLITLIGDGAGWA